MLNKITIKENLKNPFVVHTNSFTTLIKNDASSINDKFRIVIPKKNLKKAIQRNKVKRQLRALLTNFSKTETIKANIILIGNEQAYKNNYKQLEKDFNYAIKKYKKNTKFNN